MTFRATESSARTVSDSAAKLTLASRTPSRARTAPSMVIAQLAQCMPRILNRSVLSWASKWRSLCREVPEGSARAAPHRMIDLVRSKLVRPATAKLPEDLVVVVRNPDRVRALIGRDAIGAQRGIEVA